MKVILACVVGTAFLSGLMLIIYKCCHSNSLKRTHQSCLRCSSCRKTPKETQPGSFATLSPGVFVFSAAALHHRSSTSADTACKEKPVSPAAASRDLPWQPPGLISAAPGEVKRGVGRAPQDFLSLSADVDPAGSPPAAAPRPRCLCGLFKKKKLQPKAMSHLNPG